MREGITRRRSQRIDETLTLAIDIGGSHLRTALLDASGKMSADPSRVKTPRPAAPDAVVAALINLSQRLGQFDRVPIGFSGVVRVDFVWTAPNLGTKKWHGLAIAVRNVSGRQRWSKLREWLQPAIRPK